MSQSTTRRDFIARSVLGAGAIALPGKVGGVTSKGPHDFTIVEGHRDIWELSGRTRIRGEEAQHYPISNFLAPRLIDGGVSVVIMPAGGDSLEERDGVDDLLEGAMRVLDMLVTDIEKTNGKASIIKTRADIPSKPNVGKVQFFLDIEGGGAIQSNLPEPEFVPERSLALLRQFFWLGVRGVQLTPNGRNQSGDGRGVGRMGGRLTPFGVAGLRGRDRRGRGGGGCALPATALYDA